MTTACTLHEIVIANAKKQPGQVDSLTEESPILRVARWKPATHDHWHAAEKLTSIDGPSFIEVDSPIPPMSVSSDLARVDLSMMAGAMEAQALAKAREAEADAQLTALREQGANLVAEVSDKTDLACETIEEQAA